MKIVSITVIKNGSDIIESFIRYTINIVDEMIIFNDNSYDGTEIILNNLLSEKLPLIILNQNDVNSYEKSIHNFLLEKAFLEYSADVVCILDVDEFLTAISGNPREIIEFINPREYLKIKRNTYVPTVFDNNDDFILSKITHIRDEKYEFTNKVILTKELFKEYNVQLNKNNDDLIFKDIALNKFTGVESKELKIAHFPIRYIEQVYNHVLSNYPYINSTDNINANLKQFYQKTFNKIKNHEKIIYEDLTNLAKYYNLEKKEDIFKNFNQIDITYSPVNMDFCKDIKIKYGYTHNYYGELLESYVYFVNDVINIKKIDFENKNPVYLTENNFKKFNILLKLLNKDYSNLKIAIKSANPSSDKKWGDYFYASSLKRSFEKKGFNVVIHEREYWDSEYADINIVLRGLIKFKTPMNSINLMWNISHPDDVMLEEYENYDVVFIASNNYAKILSSKLKTCVKPLLQCTDLEIFYPSKDNNYNHEILFVGNTRGVFRSIIQDLLKTNHDFVVYGTGWDEFIDKKYIKGDHIPNNILNKAYSSCRILLNDHWDDMKEKDFISNRLFDALACKTFVVSDKVDSIEEVFDNAVVTYDTPEELNAKLTYFIQHPHERELKAQIGYENVLKNHTFDNRTSEILLSLETEYFSKIIDSLNK